MDKSMREIEVSQITDIVEKLCIAANEHLPEGRKVRHPLLPRLRTARLHRAFWTTSSKILKLQITSAFRSARDTGMACVFA